MKNFSNVKIVFLVILIYMVCVNLFYGNLFAQNIKWVKKFKLTTFRSILI